MYIMTDRSIDWSDSDSRHQPVFLKTLLRLNRDGSKSIKCRGYIRVC